MTALRKGRYCRVTNRFSKFGEDETDATDDVVGWSLVGAEGEKLDGEVERERTQDEPTTIELDVPKDEVCAATDGVESSLLGSVRSDGVVVTVEDDGGTVGDEGVHCSGLLHVCTDGEEALPVRTSLRGTGAIVLKTRGGDVDGLDDGAGTNLWLVQCGGERDDGDRVDGIGGGGEINRSEELKRHDLIDGEFLGCEDTVEAFKGKRALPIEKVGDVCLTKSGLTRKPGSGEATEFNPANEFKA
jgi:hypothetical protein